MGRRELYVLCRRTQSSGALCPRLRCSGVQRSSASPIIDGATNLGGRIGSTTVPLQPDTYMQLDCAFEERAGGARDDRRPVSVPCCVVPAWFVCPFLQILDIQSAPQAK